MVTCPCEWWPRYMGDKTKEFITADSVTLLVLEPQAFQIGSEFFIDNLCFLEFPEIPVGPYLW